MNQRETEVDFTPPSVLITPDRRGKTKKPAAKKKLDVVIDTPMPVLVTEVEKKEKAFNPKQQGLVDALSIAEADMKGQTTRREIAKERCLGIEHDSSFAEWANSLRDGLKNSGYTQGSADVIKSEYMVLRLACRYNKAAMVTQFEKQQKFADLIKFAREVKDAHAKEMQAKAKGATGAANDAVISPTKPVAPVKPEAKFMKEKGFESRLDKIQASVEEMNGKVDLHHLSRATEVLLDQVDAVLAQVVSITGSKYQDEYEDICAETEELKTRIRKLIEKAEKAKIEAVEAKSTKQI